MAQFAPVAPIQILEQMKEDEVLGTYHLLLAHHVLEHPDRFKALFADQRHCTIIMDNSIVELGDSQNESLVLEACRVIQPLETAPNYIFPVLTDVMGKGPETRDSIAASYDWWLKNAPGYELMAVLQGNDWNDFCVTADYVLTGGFDQITYAGIPRILADTIGTRQLAIQYVEAIRPDIATHLLGFSNNVVDDVICAQHPGVEGIDSAVPLRYTYSLDKEVGDPLYTPTKEIPPRPADWFENGTFQDVDATNLFNIRKWVA